MFKRRKTGEPPKTSEKPSFTQEQKPQDFDSSHSEEISEHEAPKVFTPRALGKPAASVSTQSTSSVKPTKGKGTSKEFQPSQSLGVDVTQDMVKELKIPEFDEPQVNKRRRNKIILFSGLGVFFILLIFVLAKFGNQTEVPMAPEDQLPPQPPLEVVQPPTEVEPEPDEPLVSDPSTSKDGFSLYHNTMLGMRLEYPSYMYTKDLTEYYLNFIRSVVPAGQGYYFPDLDLSMVGTAIPLVDFELRDKALTKVRLSLVNSELTSDFIVQPDQDKSALFRAYSLESFSDELSVYHIEYLNYERELDRVRRENERRPNSRLPLPIEPTPPSSVVDDVGSVEQTSTSESTDIDDHILKVDWSVVSHFSPQLFMFQAKGRNEISLQLVKPLDVSSLVLTLSYEYDQGTTLTTEMLENLSYIFDTITFDHLGSNGEVVSSDSGVDISEVPSSDSVTDDSTEGGTQ